MSIDKAVISKIAKLSRIKLKNGEDEKIAGELSGIFDWIEQLQEVDTKNISPMAGVGDYTLRSRADIINDGNIKDDVLANAPTSEFDCYVVPKVVD